MIDETVSRRSLLYAGAALVSGSVASTAEAQNTKPGGKLKVAIFSKHLLFVRGEQLAQTASDLGFDGIDLAVRKGGHVEPDRVKQELPGLVAMIRKHGLEVPMLTTDIADTETPYAEDILRSMSALGIRHYRWGGFKYNRETPLAKQIEALRPRVEKLAKLNARYRVGAMYHTHSGIGLVGAPIWDLHELLNGLDPAAVGVNYDVGHATVEGGFGGWIDSFRITGSYLRGIAVKDFLWGKNKRGEWRPEWKPLSEGMVRFPEFFRMVAACGFSGPLQLHFEYPLGGSEEGKGELTGSKQEVFRAMKQDLAQLRSYLKAANLA
jgi:sugar phosphate isomerase/epimerase